MSRDNAILELRGIYATETLLIRTALPESEEKTLFPVSSNQETPLVIQ